MRAPVQIGLSTACLYGFPLRYTFRLAAECGFDGVELVMAPEVALRGPECVSGLCREYGLAALSVHVALLPPGPLRNSARQLAVATRAAIALGAPSVIFHGPFARWATRRAQRWLAAVDACREMTAGTGTQLALENGGTYALADSEDVLGPIPVLCNFARRHGLALTLDVCHVGGHSIGLMETYEQMRPYLANIHFSDYARGLVGSGRLARSWRHRLWGEHQFPGEGDLPLVTFLQGLWADGYRGSLNLEIGPLALRVWSPRRVRERLCQAREFVERGLSA